MILNFLLFCYLNISDDESRIIAFIKSIILWTSLIYISILGLSAIHELRYVTVAGLYIVANAILIYIAYKKRGLSLDYVRTFVVKIRKSIIHKKSDIITGFKGNIYQKIDSVLQLLIICYVLGLGIVAVFAVPYNYDSVSYHAPRICQWVQNKSVEYYASHITRQNVSTVLGSYISTYVYILTGRYDCSMCYIQYLSYVINLFMINNIMTRLGCIKGIRRIGQILWITLPIGFAEAITPQNDLLAALWLLSFVILLNQYINEHVLVNSNTKAFTIDTLFLALTIGYAYLTKPSVCISMLIIYIAYAIHNLRSSMTIRRFVTHCMIMGTTIITINIPQFVSNYRLLGSIMADNVGKRQLIGTLQPNYVLINLLKNVTFNLGICVGGFRTDGAITGVVGLLASLLQVEINACTISEDGHEYEFPHLPSFSSDTALNLTVTFLIIMCIIMLPMLHRRFDEYARLYIKSALLSFIVFNTVLRWEVSITRYLIGYYALVIPAICVVLQEYLDRNKNSKTRNSRLILIMATTITVACLVYDMSGELYHLVRIHPIYPIKSSFTLVHNDMDEYREICDYVNNSEALEIGIIEEENTFEYPLWRMINKNTNLRHVNVQSPNMSYKLERYDIIPDMILASRDKGQRIVCHGLAYEYVLGNDCWCIYGRAE